jgi:hypothetical protein
MKKLLLFAMIILPSALLSQTVSGLQVMPGAAGSPSTVTFDVSWDEDALPALWSDTMWVFVDYNKNGKMTRLELLLSAGATLTATSAPGVGELVEENIKGAWVVGDARTNSPFSATVQLYTDETTIAGACAYASSYPPVGKYVSSSEIVFTGTPMYEITLVHENGNTFETVESGGTFLLPGSYTVSSFTDATGAPGVLGCIPSTDIYNLTVSATTYCPGNAVTFALDNTTSGRTYQLYRDDVAVMDELLGTGSAETFTGTFAGPGSYTARVKDNGTYCAAQMTGTYTVSETAPDAPTMGGEGSYCTGSANITATAGPGGMGIRWTDDDSTDPSRSVSLGGTYYAVTTSDEGCESSAATVSVTIGTPGAANQQADPTCGCVTNTSPCNGTCKQNGYTYTYDGACAAGCSLRYVKQWNQCGELVTDTYTPQSDATCWYSGCPPTYLYCDRGYWRTVSATSRDACTLACIAWAKSYNARTYADRWNDWDEMCTCAYCN